MRAMFMVVASIILAAGLFGCNRQQQVAEQAPVTAVAPPPAAAPPPPPTPAPAAEPSHRYRHRAGHRTHYASYESEDQSASYSEDENYSEGNDYSDEDYDVSTDRQSSGGAAEAHGEVWVDGYGREHTLAAAQGDDPGALSREDERLRRKVWRGWNSDCDERGN